MTKLFTFDSKQPDWLTIWNKLPDTYPAYSSMLSDYQIKQTLFFYLHTNISPWKDKKDIVNKWLERKVQLPSINYEIPSTGSKYFEYIYNDTEVPTEILHTFVFNKIDISEFYNCFNIVVSELFIDHYNINIRLEGKLINTYAIYANNLDGIILFSMCKILEDETPIPIKEKQDIMSVIKSRLKDAIENEDNLYISTESTLTIPPFKLIKDN